jgi:protein involved in polysaccharide export with SLBB domain
MNKRKPDTDSDAGEKKRAARVTPTAKAFTARIALRDTGGVEYSSATLGDVNATTLAARFDGGTTYYIRSAKRDKRGVQPRHLRRGAVVRLLDLEQRTEFTAVVADVQLSDGARATSGFVVLTSKSEPRPVTDPREFERSKKGL